MSKIIPAKNVSARFNQSIKLLVKNMYPIFWIPLLTVILFFILGYLLSILVAKIESVQTISIIILAVLFVLGGLVHQCITIYNTSQVYHDKKTNFKKGITNFFQNIGTYLSITILMMLLVITPILLQFLGMHSSSYILLSFLALIFVMIIMLRIFLTLFIAIENKTNTKDSFILSMKITKGKWWRTFGNLMYLGFISAIIMIALMLVFGLLGVPLSTISKDATSVFSFIYIGIYFFLSIFFATLQVVFYYFLFKRYEFEALEKK